MNCAFTCCYCRLFEPIIENTQSLLAGEHTRTIVRKTPTARAGGIMMFAVKKVRLLSTPHTHIYAIDTHATTTSARFGSMQSHGWMLHRCNTVLRLQAYNTAHHSEEAMSTVFPSCASGAIADDVSIVDGHDGIAFVYKSVSCS